MGFLQEAFGMNADNPRPYDGGECVRIADGHEYFVSAPTILAEENGREICAYDILEGDNIVAVAYPRQQDGDTDDPATGSFCGYTVEKVYRGLAAMKMAAYVVHGMRCEGLAASLPSVTITVTDSNAAEEATFSIRVTDFVPFSYGAHIVAIADNVPAQLWRGDLHHPDIGQC